MINVLSAPNILTTDNQVAEFRVGDQVPFPVTNTLATGGQLVENIERKPVGISLAVTPRISKGDAVTMEVEQKIERVSPEQVKGLKAPVTSERVAKTTVIAENGQTIVIGGLIQEQEIDTSSKVPLLGDIPLVGYLFRNQAKEKEKSNLIIFLTPNIIRDPADMTRISVRKNKERRRFLKKHKVGEHNALYDYELDKGLNMAPPKSTTRLEKKKKKRRRFNYDQVDEETATESSGQGEYASSRRHSTRIRSKSKYPKVKEESSEEYANLPNPRIKKRHLRLLHQTHSPKSAPHPPNKRYGLPFCLTAR